MQDLAITPTIMGITLEEQEDITRITMDTTLGEDTTPIIMGITLAVDITPTIMGTTPVEVITPEDKMSYIAYFFVAFSVRKNKFEYNLTLEYLAFYLK